MATVRHSTCRIDFDPSDVTGKSIITVSDNDGVVLDTIEIKTTHLVAAVAKQTMVQVRRNTALARILSEMDDEANGDTMRKTELLAAADVNAMEHARVCTVVGTHTFEQCVPVADVTPLSPQVASNERHSRICSVEGWHASNQCVSVVNT